ncbi:hypothetical protein PpBr36_03046 [Pyricularia pennisetigena]|uniref:hypothetical protein n=1 Tax=Pyricularia pennisetigena TaxID=1578925 RepID=UPI001152600B|nr:hypothetical protein PpBr36_03046 [Pyricularia pennisetigena]TLS30917.1 hypothetical protein PpBr36_03046 [Pyricularia pennisetigena]
MAPIQCIKGSLLPSPRTVVTKHFHLQHRNQRPHLTITKITSYTATMPTYIVTCKEDATPEQVAEAKKHAEEQGGKIGHSFDIIKGFSVEFPEDSVSTLENHEHVKAVEKDKEVKIC